MLDKAYIALKRLLAEIWSLNSGQGSERKKESCRESFHGHRENEYHHEQNADRNMDVKVVLAEVWDGNQESGGKAIL